VRILFDNSTPRGIAAVLSTHTVVEAREQGWDRLQNGTLLEAAEQEGFDLFLTPDQNIRYQQNLQDRRIAIVVLSTGRWTLIEPHLQMIAAAVARAKAGSYLEVNIPLPEKRPFHR
jgi:hypothetical protein